MKEDAKTKPEKTGSPIVYALALLAIGILLFNQYAISQIHGSMQMTGMTMGQETTKTQTAQVTFQAAMDAVIPTGVPEAYGQELGVTFDAPQESLNRLALLDGDLYPQGRHHFQDLTPDKQQRYLKIASSISCEFCCGAQTLIARDGRPACGCAHSAGMRGLAMYLLTEHDEMSDDQILGELTRWKSLFFPKQMIEHYMQNNGAVAQTGALPDMVGGC